MYLKQSAHHSFQCAYLSKNMRFQKIIHGDYSDKFLVIFGMGRVSKNISNFLKEPEGCLARDLLGVDM